MAKQWSPTQRQLSEYERLVKQYNKMRRQIIKVHRHFEERDEGGRVPSLVVPERHRKMSLKQIRVSGRKLFQMRLKQLRSVLSGGIKGFFKSYKDSYLALYREYIIDQKPELSYLSGRSGYLYSELQIRETAIDNPALAQFMRDYNSIVGMSGEIFAFLIKSGRIPAFKLIYQEFAVGGNGASFYESFASVMHEYVDLIKHLNPAQKQEIKDIMTKNFSYEKQEKMFNVIEGVLKGIEKHNSDK